jgi:transcriptional regulator with XRE-family HTH domain
MPIKQREILSRADFDIAVVQLRLNVSEIAKATGIPRTYLSEYRNGDRKLRPEHQAKLRDYFEAKGIEFEDDPDQRDETTRGRTALPVSQAAFVLFPGAVKVSQDKVQRVAELIREKEAQLIPLLKQPVKRGDWFDDGKLSDDTRDQLDLARSIMAECYLLMRALREGSAGEASIDGASAKTVRDVLLNWYRTDLEAVGMLEAAPDKDDDAEAAPDKDDDADQSADDSENGRKAA